MSDRLAVTLSEISRLKGLRLSGTGRAADMRVLDFGEESAETGYSPFTLRLQCAWRVERGGAIWTGSADYYVGPDGDCDTYWDATTQGDCLQDIKMRQLVEGFPQAGDARVPLMVESLKAGSFGDIAIYFSDGSKFVAFVSGVCGEFWRMFEPERKRPHFVAYATHVEYGGKTDQDAAAQTLHQAMPLNDVRPNP